jgi:hypothetical protein
VVILFTGGFFATRGPGTPAPKNDPWLKTIDDFNAAKVSVYSFESKNGGGGGGDFYDRPLFPENDHGASTDRIRDLAERTGGKYTPLAHTTLART